MSDILKIIKEAMTTGVAITKNGERIVPEDFYAMSNRPEHIFIHLGDGTCYVQRCEPLVATATPLAEYEMCILHLHKKLTQAQDENKRLNKLLDMSYGVFTRQLSDDVPARLALSSAKQIEEYWREKRAKQALEKA